MSSNWYLGQCTWCLEFHLANLKPRLHQTKFQITYIMELFQEVSLVFQMEFQPKISRRIKKTNTFFMTAEQMATNLAI